MKRISYNKLGCAAVPLVIIAPVLCFLYSCGYIHLYIGNFYYGKQDYSKAIHWYYKSSDVGNAHAKNKIGYMYLHGNGVEHDCLQAAIWYRQAAEAGDAESQFAVGQFYEQGECVVQDYDLATFWYEQAAAQGFEPAMEKLK